MGMLWCWPLQCLHRQLECQCSLDVAEAWPIILLVRGCLVKHCVNCLHTCTTAGPNIKPQLSLAGQDVWAESCTENNTLPSGPYHRFGVRLRSMLEHWGCVHCRSKHARVLTFPDHLSFTKQVGGAPAKESFGGSHCPSGGTLVVPQLGKEFSGGTSPICFLQCRKRTKAGGRRGYRWRPSRRLCRSTSALTFSSARQSWRLKLKPLTEPLTGNNPA